MSLIRRIMQTRELRERERGKEIEWSRTNRE